MYVLSSVLRQFYAVHSIFDEKDIITKLGYILLVNREPKIGVDIRRAFLPRSIPTRLNELRLPYFQIANF